MLLEKEDMLQTNQIKKDPPQLDKLNFSFSSFLELQNQQQKTNYDKQTRQERKELQMRMRKWIKEQLYSKSNFKGMTKEQTMHKN